MNPENLKKPVEIFENIYLIEVPLPNNPLKNLNSYLIKGSRRNLLIDTGFNQIECREALETALEALEVDFDNTDIFLIHLHSDHTGLIGSFGGPSTLYYMGEKDKKIMQSFYNKDYWTQKNKLFERIGFPRDLLIENNQKNPVRRYMPDQKTITAVVDNEKIDLGGILLTCIETPGHTPGHMCLYDEAREILFSGDHIIFDISPNIAIWEEDDHSLKDYLESLNKIKALKVKDVLSSHRKPMGDVGKRIDELIDHHNDRLAEVIEILKVYPNANAYEVTSHMTWSIRAKNWDDFPVMQKWFAVAEGAAHLEYLRGQGLIEKELSNGIFGYHLVP